MKNVFQSIATGTIVISLSRIVLKGLSLVSYLLVLQQLSLREYGIVSLALSVSGPVLAFSGLGLDDLLFANGARARGEKTLPEFLPTIRGFIFTKFGIVVVVTVVLVFIRSLLGQNYRDLFEQFFIPLIVWIWVTNVRGLADGLLQMHENFKRLAAANVIENVLRLAIVVGLAATHRISISTVIWSYVLAKIISSVVAIAPVADIARGALRFRQSMMAYLRFIKHKGFWEIIRMQIGGIFSGIGQWIIGFLLGLEAVALFAFVSTMNSFVAQFTPFRQILYPIMSRLSPESGATSFTARRMSKYAFWLAVLLIIVAAIGAPIGLTLFLPKYLIALPYFYLLLPTQLLNAATSSHGPLMYARNEQRFLLGLSLFGTISSVTIAPALMLVFGLYGAILENHLSTFIIAWLRERRLRRRHDIQTFVLRDVLTYDDFDRQAIHRFVAFIKTKVRAFV